MKQNLMIQKETERGVGWGGGGGGHMNAKNGVNQGGTLP